MARKRTKLLIVPRILKDAVKVGAIPACVVAGAGCERPPPPVVAYMPPPEQRPPVVAQMVAPSASQEQHVSPPVVAQMAVPVVPLASSDGGKPKPDAGTYHPSPPVVAAHVPHHPVVAQMIAPPPPVVAQMMAPPPPKKP